jgi:hypothetical protein
MTLRLRILAIACLLACVPTASRAEVIVTNLVENGAFDDDVAGWSDPGTHGDVVLGTTDESGGAESGSLRFEALASSTSAQSKSDCFSVHPGQPIVFGASSLGEALVPHTARAVLQFWSNATCSGALMSGKSIGSDLDGREAYTWMPVQGRGAVPAGAQGARLALTVLTEAVAPPAVSFDDAYVYEGLTCARASMVTCLNDGRFRFSATWKTPEGIYGQALAKPFAAASDSAYGTFFSPSNVEVVVKVLDGCGLNERFWVFASGLTNVETVLTVTDTYSGAKWTRKNPPDTIFLPVFDTGAFATCPH